MSKQPLPPTKLTLNQWAERYAYLSPESSADHGKWHSIPYQRAILDSFSHPKVERITWMKSARVGYTKCINHAVGYYIHQEPSPILVVQPTVDDAKGYSKDEIAPMLRDTSVLEGLIAENKSRESNNTIEKKSFPGGTLTLIGANSPRGFRRLTCRVILFDEVDGYPQTAGVEGDQIALGIKRSETFHNRKIALGSTPTIAGFSRIEKSFATSDKGYYFLQCPDCKGWHIRRFRQPDKPIILRGDPVKVSHLVFDSKHLTDALWCCPDCGSLIGYNKHREMVEGGRWIGETWDHDGEGFTFKPEFTGHIGFHVWAGYSYSPNSTPIKLAREWLSVQDDREALKTFINTVLGETWKEDIKEVESLPLMQRREDYHDLPAAVAVLTAAVDVQDDRLEVEVVAWGHGEESWSVDYETIWGDPGRPKVWADLDALRARKYVKEGNTVVMISAMAIDSGGHHTQTVYDYCERRFNQRVFAVKGVGGVGIPLVKPTKVKVSASGRMMRMFLLGIDALKSTVYARLAIDKPGPGYCHFPVKYEEEYFDGLTAEKIKTEHRNGFANRTWIKVRARNEPLDLRVYATAALRIINTSLNYVGEQQQPRARRRVRSRGIAG